MAWITKNSANTKIPRRDEPYLSGSIRARLERDVLPKYPTKHAALLPVLHELQHHVGWLPYQCLMEVAAFLDLKPADVLDTASFYDEFHLEPLGRHIIGVCQSISCEACGHETLLDFLRAKLDIEPGETTADGLFTVRCMECLGACDGAPCGLVNEDRHDLLTPDALDHMIDEIREIESRASDSASATARSPMNGEDESGESMAAAGRDDGVVSASARDRE